MFLWFCLVSSVKFMRSHRFNAAREAANLIKERKSFVWESSDPLNMPIWTILWSFPATAAPVRASRSRPAAPAADCGGKPNRAPRITCAGFRRWKMGGWFRWGICSITPDNAGDVSNCAGWFYSVIWPKEAAIEWLGDTDTSDCAHEARYKWVPKIGVGY